MPEPLVVPRDGPSPAHAAVLQAARRALMRQGGGVWLSGEAGTGKTALLDDLLGGLPGSWAVLRHDGSTLGPKELAEGLNGAVQALAHGAGRSGIVLAIDDADRLRRDTLDVLEGMAGWLFRPERRVQLVLASRPSFGARLTANRQDRLASCLASRLHLLPPGIPDAAPSPARSALAGRQPGPIGTELEEALDRLARRPRRLVRRWAAVAVPGGLALAGIVGGVWYNRVPALSRMAIELASAAPVPLALASAPELLAGTASPASIPAAPAILEPLRPVPPDPAMAGAAPPLAALLAAPDPDEGTPPVLLAALPDVAAPMAAAGSAVVQAPGLLLVAQPGDTLPTLYQQVYRGTVAPAFRDVQAANPGPVRPGRRMLFPSPPQGWVSH